ncbi:MAG: twin-arginine translocase subunit TatC [Elusimicrobia bacterium]|nr:twin-arginine translocase subunit TatC [Elusimicrobiota bacterium]MBD3412517.1 twin-arginine translocase subunit TatC [Elusimicrobiota bacterium]
MFATTDHKTTITDHLEELRQRLFVCLAAVVIASIAGYFFVDHILEHLSRFAGPFVFLFPTEALMAKLKCALYVGIFAALPVILFEIWQFIVSALTPREKKALLWLVPFSYTLFCVGILFAYYVIIPQGTRFLLAHAEPYMQPFISVDRFLGFVVFLCVTFGFVFQIPVLVFFLTTMRLITASRLARSRKYVIVGIVIAAGVLTPGPDVFSQILMAVPTWLLFEMSVVIARVVGRE